MSTNYLYIDDEIEEVVNGITKNLTSDELSTVVQRAMSWDTEITNLIEKRELDKYDGLLIDLQLKFSTSDSEQVKYFGPDLVQAIRTKVKSGHINDLPILLCSSENKLLDLFDKTSLDLFDKKYDKVKDLSNDSAKTELISFSTAYKKLNAQESLQKILETDEDLFEFELEFNKLKTPHEKINFIYNQLILKPGLVLDESLLAIRLGIDKNKSKDWEEIKNKILAPFKYEGILHEFNDRWWQSRLLRWWKENFKTSLQVIPAFDRVKLLKEKFNLDGLNPLTLPDHQRYETFWYKCLLSDTPLESADGFKTIEMPKYFWQEPSFISLSHIWSEERSVAKIKELLGNYESERLDEIIKQQK